jgi:arylsulfatase A-like enzyme
MSFRMLMLSGLLAVAVLGGALYWRAHRSHKLRTILVVSVDTLRPERTGLYGNGPDVSPNIDTLGKQSVVFDEALANSPYTLPSHMTMLTGLDPVAHGIKRDGCVLSTRVTTLAEALRDAGFECGAFTDGGYVSARYGFSQGFQVFDDHRDEHEGATNGMRRIVPLATNWLDHHADEDVFLFVHTFDVHAPYQDGDPDVLSRFRERPVHDGPLDHELHRISFMHQQVTQRVSEYGRMAELLNDYDSGVFEADRGIGQLLDWLKSHDRYDGALVIVTGDHGESFADHGIHVGHGIGLTDDEIHIPLVVKLPHAEQAGRRVPVPVSLLDLAPTVLDTFKVPPAPEMQGESLLGLARGAPRHGAIFGYSPNTESIYLVENGWKYISPPSIPPMEVAHRHLGPTMPPDGGLTADRGKDYDFGRDEYKVTLHYDDAGDPLAIRDTILTGSHLYNRATDPHEMHNAWEENKAGIGKQIAEDLNKVYDASLTLNRNLDDGIAPPAVGQVHVDQTLLQIGYAGAITQAQAQQFLSQLPASLKAALQDPYEPPDVSDVVQADKFMQFVRLAVRDGRKLKPGFEVELNATGDKLFRWALEHPQQEERIGWRLYELAQLADENHVPVDSGRWLGKYREWLLREQAAAPPADAATPDKAPPADAASGDAATPGKDVPH